MGTHKLSDNNLKEMFNEGRFIARALSVNALDQGHAETAEAENEIRFLNRKSLDGEHSNVQRDGQRGRSATLLVPGVDMSLFNSVGFVYDADKSTVKAYMFYDSQTMSQTNSSDYYNVNVDKHKFEPILSRDQFIEQYKEFMHKADNPQLRDNLVDENARQQDYDAPELFGRYNEVLGNFFPESLTALVGRDTELRTLRDLLLLRQLMDEKYDMNLPMTLMGQGAINVWHPNLSQIALILNQSKAEIIASVKKTDEDPLLLMQELAHNLGYSIAISDLELNIKPEHLSIRNKNEFKADELVDYISKLTGTPKGGPFTYGLIGRLTEIINQRLNDEGIPLVKHLNNTIIQKEDIANLIILLDNELAIKTEGHVPMDNSAVEQLVDAISSDINLKRTSPDQFAAQSKLLGATIERTFFAKVSEFFTKIYSLFTDNAVTKKVESFNSLKKALNEVKSEGMLEQIQNNNDVKAR